MPWRRLAGLLGAAAALALLLRLLPASGPLACWLVPPFAALALGAPDRALALLVFLLPWLGQRPGGPDCALLPLAALGLLAGLGLRLAREGGGRAPPSPWRAPLFLLAAVSLLSLVPHLPQLPLVAEDWGWKRLGRTAACGSELDPTYPFTAWGLLAAGLAFHLAAARQAREAAGRRLLLGAAAGGLALAALAGLGEVAGLFPLAWWRDLDPVANRAGLHLQSLFWHPGWAALYLCATCFLALGWAGERAGWRRTAGRLAALLGAAAGVLTLQRALLLALGAGLGVILLAGRRARQQAGLGASLRPWLLALLLLAAAGFSAGVHRFAHTPLLNPRPAASAAPKAASAAAQDFRTPLERLTAQNRFALWTAAGEMFLDRPLAGWGLGAFGRRYLDYRSHWRRPKDYDSTHGTAHNTYLDLLVGAGPLALGAFLFLLAAAGRRLAANLRAGGWGGGAEALGPLAALAALAVYAGFENLFYQPAVAFTFWLVLALAAAAPGPAAPPVSRGRGLFLAALLLALAAGQGALCAREARLAAAGHPALAGFSRREYLWAAYGRHLLFRWMGQRGRLSFAPAGRRRLVLLACPLNPDLGERPLGLTLRLEGGQPQRQELALAPGGNWLWRPVAFSIPAELAGRRRLTLEVELDRTWRPDDPRWRGRELRVGPRRLLISAERELWPPHAELGLAVFGIGTPELDRLVELVPEGERQK